MVGVGESLWGMGDGVACSAVPEAIVTQPYTAAAAGLNADMCGSDACITQLQMDLILIFYILYCGYPQS